MSVADDIDDNRMRATGAGRCTRTGGCPTSRRPGRKACARAGRSLLRAAVGMALLLCLSLQPASAQDTAAPAAAVPYGWRLEQAADGLLLVRAPAGDALLTAWVRNLPDGTGEQAALEACVNALSGSEPQLRQDKGYQFHFRHDDARHTALFFAARRRYMLITVSDPANRYPESMEMLVHSLEQWLKDGSATTERQGNAD